MKEPFNQKNKPFVDMPAWPLGFALKLVLLYFIAPILLIIVLGIVSVVIPEFKAVIRSSVTESGLYITVAVYYSFALGYTIFQLRKRKQTLYDLGFRKFNILTAIKYFLLYPFYYVACVLLLLGTIIGTAHLFGFSLTPEDIKPTNEPRSFIWPAFIVTALLVPIIEELVFRGILLPAIAKRKGWLKGGIYSSLLFSALHGPVAPFIMIASLYLSMMYRKTGSIIPGIILHMTNNSLVYLALSS